MRLTHLKLAGFKSFVDPTTLHIHGYRVGIVGPNGCGKSNIMEAVRWVLGESSAKELRGDSMQDVIFNGSGNRKPVSRASVELHFDNSLGGAAGAWSQYAEIAVKRVLEREGGSTYYINNTQVRRRDVADLFLGTGLGGRAYAIIGQNTISRIVEARPEELRVFLEEAAGISKYKERRRETELRLRDTRENLLRVSDIMRELEKQIARLEVQAEVASEYHRLQQAMKLSQSQLWLLRKRVAATDLEKSQRVVEKTANELEAQTAQLRKTENDLVHLRQEHYLAGDALQQAQGRYYEASAGLSNIEQQLKHTQEKREQLHSQLEQIQTQQEKLQAQQQTRKQELEGQQQALQQALSHAKDSHGKLAAQREKLPQIEADYKNAQNQANIARSKLSDSEQAIRLENANLQHMQRQCAEQKQRLQRLQSEIAAVMLPAQEDLEAKITQGQVAESALQTLEAEISGLQQQDQQLSRQQGELQQVQNEQSRQVAHMQAQHATLLKIQHGVGHESQLDNWLERHGIDQPTRLWECFDVTGGWETAVEAVLGHRLNAISGSMHDVNSRPPALVALFNQGDMSPAHASDQDLPTLQSTIQVTNPVSSAALNEWLAGVYVLHDETRLAEYRSRLQPQQMLVNKQGDIFTRHTVSLFAPQAALHGVIERQRELAQISADIPVAEEALHQTQEQYQKLEQQIRHLRQQLAALQQQQRNQANNVHAAKLELQRLQQQQQHGLERRQRLQDDVHEVTTRVQELERNLTEMTLQQHDRQGELTQLQIAHTSAQRQLQENSAALHAARNLLVQMEKDHQQADFSVQMLESKIHDLQKSLETLQENLDALLSQREQCETNLTEDVSESIKIQLQQALDVKHQREQELAQARDQLSTQEQQLQSIEQQRLQIEQQLHPLRDRLEQNRLNEQQAQLHFQHCQDEIARQDVDEEEISKSLPASAKVPVLEQQIGALETQITELGAVNLAAIQELAAERERASYLQSQAQDLNDAAETLEDAIRKIDRETRSRLQQTFDEANRHFGELFQVLFGGGQARLQLLGEEILDTGVQVFAQPPGKKNSTIHLLSGGEKALTAIALVFALFKLNPAPFCLMDEVDAPLDDSNTERFCAMVKKMSANTQFLFVSHNRITMEMAQQLIGVTMQESGVSRIVEVDVEAAMQMNTEQLL